jgi:hypothetical protein
MNCFMRAALLASVTIAFAASAYAHVTKFDILRTEPAFGGTSFGEAGAYQPIVARAHGELDPAAPVNAVIQDIALAPRMLKCRDRKTSEVRGVSEWITPAIAKMFLSNLLDRGYSVGLPVTGT